MTNARRSDFPDSTKRLLATRVAHTCCNPSCRATTSGPQLDPAKALNLGVAAHITAASEGGPRFDARLTDEQREAPDNGIWLCQNCAKLVDNDPPRFPIALLQDWKIEAENEALSRIGRAAEMRATNSARVDAQVRFTAHQARFVVDPELFYFLNVTNIGTRPIEITHLWYEEPGLHILVRPASRPLPCRIEVSEAWSSWIPIRSLPVASRVSSYDRFRLRLSSGEFLGSVKDEGMPPAGSVAGGPIVPSDIPRSTKLPTRE